MGYFSNGTEGILYEEKYCSKCIHFERGCAVLMAHELHNYQECNNDDSILSLLIPRSKAGPWNDKCLMFIETAKTYKGTQPKHLADWINQHGITAIKEQ